MDELNNKLNLAMKSTKESGLVLGGVLKSILKRLNEGGK
ncbi:hypothetical protein PIL02S_03344 [Paenibacillus illinoisensis]|uniref:Uncharacterized protein n=1 Tax=Paenibacillus illinoisensis TaxID=59845 RepID=A0A2W0CK48_9BACL|nr:hypothetical protein PIL02S_03344 [Paenibacillus illinoisensis]